MASNIAYQRVEAQQQPGPWQTFVNFGRKVQSIICGEPSAIDRITSAYLEQLQQRNLSLVQQHHIIGTWSIECTRAFNFTPLGIKTSSHWLNKQMLAALKKFAPHSPYARELQKRPKQQSLPIHIFKDVSHPDCDVCKLARGRAQLAEVMHSRAEKAFYELLFPNEESEF